MAFNQGFFPQMGGYGQPMQPMYQQQTMQQRQAQDQPLFCRAVTNRDEVQAWPVDFGGQAMTFLGPGLQTVWIKVFNPNTGGSDVIEYRPAAPAKAEAPAVPTMEDFKNLQEMVKRQGEEIAKMRGATRRRTARETVDEEDV